MPMFRDPEDEEERRPSSMMDGPSPPSSEKKHTQPPQSRVIGIQTPVRLVRQLSEESIRTELCEGPLSDCPAPGSPPLDTSPQPDTSMATSDRGELIERLKRGESPTWIPRHLETLLQHRGAGPLSPTRTRSPRVPSDSSPTLLPAATIVSGDRVQPGQTDERLEVEERVREGQSIERPRSALHSGDFTQYGSSRADHGGSRRREQEDGMEGRNRGPLGRGGLDDPDDQGMHSPPPWLSTSPPRPTQAIDIQRTPLPGRPDSYERGFGASAAGSGFGWSGLSGPGRSGLSSLSSSLSSSFVYKHPTSPLVQSESNDDVDFSVPLGQMDIDSGGPWTSPRRHTLTTPRAAAQAQHTSVFVEGRTRQARQAHQAHQPRRSLTLTSSISILARSTPTSPGFWRATVRRPSLGSDSSPLQHASMVGSYEESILRGRMSTTPSRPLDFLAQIGVLGLGKCKASLRCPPHVTLPFSAVFYSYSSAAAHGRSSGGATAEDGPSPYVGMIDLENGLANTDDEARARRKLQSRSSAARRAATRTVDLERDHGAAAAASLARADVNMSGVGSAVDVEDEDCMESADADAQTLPGTRSVRSSRRPASPKAPPGGSYRIPAKGQLQIIIKNQNKTAVKLFLVPYDLCDMEPGTKTFIRQRSFSDGAAMDAGESGAAARGREATGPAAAASARPILRYLIHLHICCPSKGRYYLYKSVRVVFANRVPDGKEKLRNEVTLPEPRFSAYKHVRVMHPPPPLAGGGAGAGTLLAADKAFRRRSSGFTFGGPHAQQAFDASLLLGGAAALSPSHSHVPPPFNSPSSSLLAQVGASAGQRYPLVSASAASALSSSIMFRSPSSPPSTAATGASSPAGIGGVGCSVDVFGGGSGGANLPVEPVPLRPLGHGGAGGGHFRGLGSVASTQSQGSDGTSATGLASPSSHPVSSAAASRPASRGNQESASAVADDAMPPPVDIAARYNKLSKGDVGYGGNAFVVPSSPGVPGSPAAAEGLLSKRLRSLGVRGGGAAPTASGLE